MPYFDRPDNLFAFEAYEEEQERLQRMRKRIAHEWGDDYEEDCEDEYI